MGKPIIQKTYLFGTNIVEVLPYFLYEVSIYEIRKNMVILLHSQLYKSDKSLTINKDVTVKKVKDYLIVRYVDILGVTEEFIKENHLKIYRPQKLKKKK